MKKLHPLRVYRQGRQLSLAELAVKVDTSTATLSRIERGEQWPDRALIKRLIAATGGKLSFNDFGEFSAEGTDAA